MNIFLSQNRKPAWHSGSGIHSRGHAFDQKDCLHQASDLSCLFDHVSDAAHFSQILKSLNGSFCVIIESHSSILAAVDRAASMPLYWSLESAHPFVTDDPEEAMRQMPAKKTDADRVSEYLLSGFISGNSTLQEGLQTLPAGQILEYSKSSGKLQFHDYFLYQHIETEAPSEALLFKELDLIHQNCIQRLIQSVDSRPIALPLSGGYDSRLIAIMLRRLGYKNLSAFCYGDPRSREAIYSKALAHSLDLPWKFIEHKHQDWFKAYQSKPRQDFYLYAGSVSSRPHIQDWLAVQELKNSGHFDPQTVFVPGHSGDFIEGSYIPSSFMKNESVSRELFLAELNKNIYKLWKLGPNTSDYLKPIHESVAALLDLPRTMNFETAASLFELFYWRQQQPKFIVNSLRVYEYFGFQWRTPWWDAELLEFWKRIPASRRLGRAFYLDYVHKYRDTGLPTFKKENMPRRIRERLIRQRWGYIYEPRYSRFAELTKDISSRSTPIGGLLPQGLQLPGFINPKARIADCNINGLLALVALSEWWEAPLEGDPS